MEPTNAAAFDGVEAAEGDCASVSDRTPTSVMDDTEGSTTSCDLDNFHLGGRSLTMAEKDIAGRVSCARQRGQRVRARAILCLLLFAAAEFLLYMCILNPYLRATDIIKFLATFFYPHQTMLHILLLIITPMDTSECPPSLRRPAPAWRGCAARPLASLAPRQSHSIFRGVCCSL